METTAFPTEKSGGSHLRFLLLRNHLTGSDFSITEATYMSMAQLSCVSRGPGSPDRHRRSQAWHRLGRYDSAKSRKRKRVFSRPLIDTDSSLSIRTPRVNVCLLPDPIIRRWTQMSADGEPLTAFICVHLRHLRIRPSVRTRRVNVRSVRDPIIRRWTDVCRRVSDHPRSETLPAHGGHAEDQPDRPHSSDTRLLLPCAAKVAEVRRRVRRKGDGFVGDGSERG